MCRKEPVLYACSRVLDAVEVNAPLAVTRGDLVVRASDDHEGRTRDEADKVLFEFGLRKFFPDFLVEYEIELPALKIPGARAARWAGRLSSTTDRRRRCPFSIRLLNLLCIAEPLWCFNRSE